MRRKGGWERGKIGALGKWREGGHYMILASDTSCDPNTSRPSDVAAPYPSINFEANGNSMLHGVTYNHISWLAKAVCPACTVCTGKQLGLV